MKASTKRRAVLVLVATLTFTTFLFVLNAEWEAQVQHTHEDLVIHPATGVATKIPSKKPLTEEPTEVLTEMPVSTQQPKATQEPVSINEVSPESECHVRESDKIMLNQQDKITLVLTTTKSDDNGYPRLELLMNSLKKFHASWMHELIVITPDSEVTDIGQQLETISFHLLPMRVISETTLLVTPMQKLRDLTPERESTSNGGRGTGYRISMMLKLSASKIINTKWYISLDNDVFLKKIVSFDDLVPGGKGLIQGKDEGRHRKSWWDSSMGVLESPDCRGSEFIGITPSLMSTALSRCTLEEVSSIHKAPFDEVLMQKLSVGGQGDWTEYTLYWLYACKHTLTAVYHSPSPSGLKLYDTSGFTFGSFNRYNVDRVFASNSVFGVIQSINGAAAKTVINKLKHRF
eukprot:TRINITY_DN25200_c0_g1_i1.p1 TRINITY_DN25200_c0_g1~~TRINITY_DN25200_c0_g1_i1.p1  ORF type:complete len:404 (+),score=76.81 TRINITY_DN25200_c0_g1_i1:81-1292(+)